MIRRCVIQKKEIQFGKPIGGFQLQQKKLAEMITEITKAQLLNWRLGVLMNEGKATPQQVSMAKRNACEIGCQYLPGCKTNAGWNGYYRRIPRYASYDEP